LFFIRRCFKWQQDKKKRRIYKKLTNLFFFSFAHRGKICNRPTLAPACLPPFARAIFNISFPLLP
jgi:hypothetical protein